MDRQARRIAQAVGLKGVPLPSSAQPDEPGDFRLIDRVTGAFVASLYYEMTAKEVIEFCAEAPTSRGAAVAAERVKTLTAEQLEKVEHEIAVACLRLEASGVIFRRLVDDEVRWVDEVNVEEPNRATLERLKAAFKKK